MAEECKDYEPYINSSSSDSKESEKVCNVEQDKNEEPNQDEDLLNTVDSVKKKYTNDQLVLIKNSYSIKKVVKYCTPFGWEKVFEDAAEELNVISEKIKFIEKSHRVVPNKEDLFRAFHICPLEKVRVVIVGQDPYQNLDYEKNPVATGCSFSVRKNQPIPPSLRNIFKEIKRVYPDCKIGDHGCLEKWSEQGVLLLNSCLTTNLGVSGAHSKYNLWMPFIVYVLEAIAEHNSKCIYLLWGKDAQKIEIHLKKNPIVLKTSHPSGFSADRGFNGCGCFQEVNKLLDIKKQPKLAKGKTHHWSILAGPIDWSLD